MNIHHECKFFTAHRYQLASQLKKAEAYQRSDFYFYSKFYLHKSDVLYSINEHESDDEFTYEFLLQL